MNEYNLKMPDSPPPVPGSGGVPPQMPRGNKAKEFGRTFLFGFALLVCFILAAIGRIYWNDTFVAWWIPVMIAFFLSIPLSLIGERLWSFLSGFPKRWINFLLSVVTFTGIFYFLILFINYRNADFSHADTQRVEVVKKFSVSHTRSGGRRGRVYRHYDTWHYEFSLPDGRTKSVEVSLQSYNKIRVGTHRNVKIARGLLGMEVFRPE